MARLKLESERLVGLQYPTYIIAEIGQNHQGSVETAKLLIDAALQAGADCVKFQKTSLSHKFAKSSLERSYDCEHSWGKTYGDHKKFLEFSNELFHELKLYADSRNITFTASAKDIPSLNFLINLNVPFIKVGSGDSDDFSLLREAAKCGRPLVISTGMQDMTTTRQIYNTVKEYHNNFALLHCISSYPTLPEDVNLNVLKMYQKEFSDVVIGYSGHEMGTIISTAAVALGARIIERHLTLDKSQKGSDHTCSLLPTEFEQMVTDIRTIEGALGDGHKRFVPCERPCYEKLGKSLVAARNLFEGDILTEKDINSKITHPNGIPAKKFQNLIGLKLKKCVNYDEPILLHDLEIESIK